MQFTNIFHARVILGNEVQRRAMYLRFGTCYEVDIKQLCSSGIHKYKLSILSPLSEFLK